MNNEKQRHKWKKDENGKYCVKCGSRVNDVSGMVKYIERGEWGIKEGVNWYPRCHPPRKRKVK